METWDLAVIGGGPAGASAALVAGGNGLATCLLEAGDELGGQLHWADAPIVDLLGQPGASGPALAHRLRPQLESAGVEVHTNTPVVALDPAGDALQLTLADGARLQARRVLIATGLRRRTLGIPGEELAEWTASPRRDAASFAGAKVIVVGGGDEAADTARGLAAAGAEVTMLVRERLRARPVFADPLRVEAGLTILEGARLARLSSEHPGTVIADLQDGRRLEARACFVRIGAEPVLPSMGLPVDRHPDGRLVVGPGGATSDRRLFAAGDLIHAAGERYLSAAMGSGAIAARAIEASLSPLGGRGGDETTRRG